MSQEQRQPIYCPKCKNMCFKISGVSVGCEVDTLYCPGCLLEKVKLLDKKIWEELVKEKTQLNIRFTVDGVKRYLEAEE